MADDDLDKRLKSAAMPEMPVKYMKEFGKQTMKEIVLPSKKQRNHSTNQDLGSDSKGK